MIFTEKEIRRAMDRRAKKTKAGLVLEIVTLRKRLADGAHAARSAMHTLDRQDVDYSGRVGAASVHATAAAAIVGGREWYRYHKSRPSYLISEIESGSGPYRTLTGGFSSQRVDKLCAERLRGTGATA